VLTLLTGVAGRVRAAMQSLTRVEESRLAGRAHRNLGAATHAQTLLEAAIAHAEPFGLVMPVLDDPTAELLERHPPHRRRRPRARWACSLRAEGCETARRRDRLASRSGERRAGTRGAGTRGAHPGDQGLGRLPSSLSTSCARRCLSALALIPSVRAMSSGCMCCSSIAAMARSRSSTRSITALISSPANDGAGRCTRPVRGLMCAPARLDRRGAKPRHRPARSPPTRSSPARVAPRSTPEHGWRRAPA
jgi:hypothetical protein